MLSIGGHEHGRRTARTARVWAEGALVVLQAARIVSISDDRRADIIYWQSRAIDGSPTLPTEGPGRNNL